MTWTPGYSRTYLLTGTLFFIFFCSRGQVIDPPAPGGEQVQYDIRWVSQYPAIKEKKDPDRKEKKGRRNSNWFTDLIFGKKPDELVKPMSIVALSPDEYWVADQGTGSILQVHEQVGEITQFKKNRVEDIPSMVDCCFTPDRKIMFTDSRLNQVFLFDPDTRELQVLIDSMHLVNPTGIAFSPVTQQIWVAETGMHRISVFDSEGSFIKYLGGRGNEHGKFNFPTYLWIDEAGQVFVVDAMNFRIQIFDMDGNFITVFGEIGDSSGYFSRPKGIATDSFGHIYVADALFHVVQVFDRSGQLLYTFGSQGDDKEQFWMPTGIYIDKENFIYIADSYNSRIQVFQLSTEN